MASAINAERREVGVIDITMQRSNRQLTFLKDFLLARQRLTRPNCQPQRTRADLSSPMPRPTYGGMLIGK